MQRVNRLDCPFYPSPNHSSRKGADVLGSVIHYTAGGSAGGSVSWLCNPQSKASAHFVISRSGDTTQIVDIGRKAWHAGVSEAAFGDESLGDVSRYTIGIELANHGMLQKINGTYYYELGRSLKKYRRAAPVFARLSFDHGVEVDGWWEPYQDEQIDALQELILKLKKAGHKEAAENLMGHEEIAMPLSRKIDPGPLFPWNRFLRKTEGRTTSRLVTA